MPWSVAAAGVAAAGSIYASKQSAGAAGDAGDAQTQAAQLSAQESANARNQLRGDLQPYANLGKDVLPQYQNLLTNPQAQVDYLQHNPVYQYGLNQANNTLLSNAAARGKLGSGGTAKALTDQTLSLGENFLNNRYQNLLAPLSLGENAASQQGNAGVTAAGQIGNALTTGAARAGAYDTQAAGYQGDAINTGAQAGAGLLNYFRPSQSAPAQGYGYHSTGVDTGNPNAFSNYA